MLHTVWITNEFVKARLRLQALVCPLVSRRSPGHCTVATTPRQSVASSGKGRRQLGLSQCVACLAYVMQYNLISSLTTSSVAANDQDLAEAHVRIIAEVRVQVHFAHPYDGQPGC